MRIFFVYIIVFVCYSMGVLCQGFNRSYWLTQSRYSNSKSVLEVVPGNYIVSGLTYDTTQTPWHNRLTFLGLDNTGNVQWRKDYGSKAFEYLDGWQSGEAFIKKGGYLYSVMIVRD